MHYILIVDMVPEQCNAWRCFLGEVFDTELAVFFSQELEHARMVVDEYSALGVPDLIIANPLWAGADIAERLREVIGALVPVIYYWSPQDQEDHPSWESVATQVAVLVGDETVQDCLRLPVKREDLSKVQALLAKRAS